MNAGGNEAAHDHTSHGTAIPTLDPDPSNVEIHPPARIPRELSPRLYKIQVSLILSIIKYIMGFFDSMSSKGSEAFSESTGHQQRLIEWKWQSFLSRYQGVSDLVRNKKDFTQSRRDEVFARSKNMARVRTIIGNILNEKVYQLSGALNDCSPYILAYFWSICRILHNISPQLGYSAKQFPYYVTEFARALQGPLNVFSR